MTTVGSSGSSSLRPLRFLVRGCCSSRLLSAMSCLRSGMLFGSGRCSRCARGAVVLCFCACAALGGAECAAHNRVVGAICVAGQHPKLYLHRAAHAEGRAPKQSNFRTCTEKKNASRTKKNDSNKKSAKTKGKMYAPVSTQRRQIEKRRCANTKCRKLFQNFQSQK